MPSSLHNRAARHNKHSAIPSVRVQIHEDDIISYIKDHPIPFILILESIQDAHNLGACLRSADAAGVTAVVIPKDRSAHLTPAARKVASGAAETVPLVRVTNLVRCLRALGDRGIKRVGLAGEGETEVHSEDLKGPLALVLGAEGKGLRRLTRDNCDALVRIPMAGSVESLNISVAAGVVLFEAIRQRSLG